MSNKFPDDYLPPAFTLPVGNADSDTNPPGLDPVQYTQAFPVDLADDTAMCEFLALTPDEFLDIADLSDEGSMGRDPDFWFMVAAVLKGRVLPVDRLIEVLRGLAGSNGNG